MYVNPGSLNKQISIVLIETVGTDKDGFLQQHEKLVRRCNAKVSNTSGSEITKANSQFSEAKKRFLVRYTDVEINTDMIVRYCGRDYDIQYINNYGDGKEYLEIWTSMEERV